VDGKVADAVLGRFQKGNEQFVAVLEDKGARDPLDRPLAGRRMRTDLEACLPILRFPAPPPAAGTDDAPARATVRRGSTSRPPLVASWIPSKRTLLQSRQFDRPRSVPLGRVAITSLRSKRTWPTVR
jgi:hypothetical protein